MYTIGFTVAYLVVLALGLFILSDDVSLPIVAMFLASASFAFGLVIARGIAVAVQIALSTVITVALLASSTDGDTGSGEYIAVGALLLVITVSSTTPGIWMRLSALSRDPDVRR